MTFKSTLKTTTATLFALIGAGSVALAADMLDTDGDGSVSKEELMTAHPDLTEEVFAQIDTDGDGMLSDEEMAAAREANLVPAG